MSVYLAALLFAVSVGLIAVGVAQIVSTPTVDLNRRLAELDHTGQTPFGLHQRRSRQQRRERWETLLRQLGERVGSQGSVHTADLRHRMIQAGYHSPSAPAIFWGLRVALTLVGGSFAMLLAPFAGTFGLIFGLWLAAMGWIAPSFYLDRRLRKRQKELQLALPDALDMLVTCVEAGLGLNQAIVRVSEEIRHISFMMSQELAMVNLEMRAGRPRAEALRNLADRTGVEDIRSLTAMLIQTDKFGTSVAQALRVQADTLRTKRRQRAEEAAAKTTIKILFPLLFCIFPGLFVVIIGPGVIQIYETIINR